MLSRNSNDCISEDLWSGIAGSQTEIFDVIPSGVSGVSFKNLRLQVLQKKKSKGVRAGDLAGPPIDPLQCPGNCRQRIA